MSEYKKWYVNISLTRGIGEQHGFIRLDIEQAQKLLRYINEQYYNCVETPVDYPLMDHILECFTDMDATYQILSEMERSGLD